MNEFTPPSTEDALAISPIARRILGLPRHMVPVCVIPIG